jgi:hypothetical protein
LIDHLYEIDLSFDDIERFLSNDSTKDLDLKNYKRDNSGDVFPEIQFFEKESGTGVF